MRVILSSLTLKSSLALLFSITLTIYQFIFLPLLVKTMPDASGLLISLGVLLMVSGLRLRLTLTHISMMD